jgi:glutathione S-transferase
MQLIIGTKSWSTWSLRPWLVLKRTGQPFEEHLIRLRWDGAADEIRAVSPSGKVPALKDGDLTLWDSLAISEYLAERFPDAGLWPADPGVRAVARAVTAEMHAGFQALRNACPMDLALRRTAALDDATTADVRRIVALWRDCRSRFGTGGPWLFGDWSIADAFYTPVATRFRSYGVDLAAQGDDGTAAAYLATLLADPAFLAWEADALAENPEPAVGAAKL